MARHTPLGTAWGTWCAHGGRDHFCSAGRDDPRSRAGFAPSPVSRLAKRARLLDPMRRDLGIRHALAPLIDFATGT